MKSALLLSLFLLASAAHAATSPSGEEKLARVKQCVMQNDAAFCHSIMTSDSYPLFDRFRSYKLMPCLPTDFIVEKEERSDTHTTLTLTMQAGANMHYILRLLYDDSPSGPLLNIPASLRRGLGDKWENKIQLAEQLYLMMKQNMGDKLTCDMLNDLVKN